MNHQTVKVFHFARSYIIHFLKYVVIKLLYLHKLKGMWVLYYKKKEFLIRLELYAFARIYIYI